MSYLNVLIFQLPFFLFTEFHSEIVINPIHILNMGYKLQKTSNGERYFSFANFCYCKLVLHIAENEWPEGRPNEEFALMMSVYFDIKLYSIESSL